MGQIDRVENYLYLEYLKPYNCVQLIFLRIFTLSYHVMQH